MQLQHMTKWEMVLLWKAIFPLSKLWQAKDDLLLDLSLCKIKELTKERKKEGKELSKNSLKRTYWKVQGQTQRERVTPLGSLNSLQGHSFPGFCLLSGQSSWFVPPTWLICLRTLHWGAHTPLNQDGSWRLLGGTTLIMAWYYHLTFDPKEPFYKCILSPLSLKETGNGDPLILYSNRVLSLSLTWLSP